MGGPTLLETNEVTIIDFSKIDNATENGTIPLEDCKDVLKIAHDLKDAFSHRKVVYLINHDITEEEARNMYTILQTFLALPDVIKEKYKSQQRKNLHGYMPSNSEQFYGKDQFEIRESFNIIGKDRDFPTEEIPEYTQCVKNLSKKLLRISHLLLQLFAIGLVNNGWKHVFVALFHNGNPLLVLTPRYCVKCKAYAYHSSKVRHTWQLKTNDSD